MLSRHSFPFLPCDNNSLPPCTGLGRLRSSTHVKDWLNLFIIRCLDTPILMLAQGNIIYPVTSHACKCGCCHSAACKHGGAHTRGHYDKLLQ